MSDEAHELVLASAARRAPTDRLPEAVAAAVVNFMTSALIQEPRRVGHRIVPERREVVVVRIEHRRDVYRGV